MLWAATQEANTTPARAVLELAPCTIHTRTTDRARKALVNRRPGQPRGANPHGTDKNAHPHSFLNTTNDAN